MRGRKQGNATPSNSTTLIAGGTRILGDVHFRGSLEVEGEVVGNLIADKDDQARVRVLESGLVKGEIHVPAVVVNGAVEGDVHATGQVMLAAKARVEGNIHYTVIEIQKGAQVNGSFVHVEAGLRAGDERAAPVVGTEGPAPGVDALAKKVESANSC